MSDVQAQVQATPSQGQPDSQQTAQDPQVQGQEQQTPQDGVQQSQQTQQAQPAFDFNAFFQQAQQMAQSPPVQEPQQGQSPQEDGKTEPQDGQPEQKTEGEIDPANLIPEHWSQYQAPEGVPDAFKLEAHRLGLTQHQFQNVLALSHNYIQAQQEAQKQALRVQAEQFIKEKWGNQAEYRLNIARRALRTVDKDGSMQKMLDETGYGNHPQVLEFFYKLGENLKEGGFLRGELHTPAGQSKSPAARLYPNLPSKGTL